MAKRLPTLLDEYTGRFRAGDGRRQVRNLPVRREISAALAMRHQARRYVLDSSASRRVGELLRDSMGEILENIEFARAPFPTTYIEVDFPAMWGEWRAGQPSTETADQRVGYYIHQDTVVTLVQGKAEGPYGEQTELGIWSFRVNRPQSAPLAPLVGMRSEHGASIVKLAFVLGGQRKWQNGELSILLPVGRDMRSAEMDLNQIPLSDSSWTAGQLAAHYDLRPTYDLSELPEHVRVETMFDGAFMGGGDPIILTAALLLLTEGREVISVGKQPGQRVLYKGKNRWVQEYSVLKIKLDAGPLVLRYSGHHSDRASPIGHDVEGHWKNYNRPPYECSHAWEPLGQERTQSGDYRRYWCPLCLQRRTWTEAYWRGDSSQGITMRDYDVKG